MSLNVSALEHLDMNEPCKLLWTRPRLLSTKDFWTMKQKKLVFSRELIFKFDPLESPILNRPWPVIWKKSHVKIGQTDYISNFSYPVVFLYQTHSESERYYDGISYETISFWKY